jgi:hypothetical protein
MNNHIREIRPAQSYGPATERSSALVAHLIGELIRRQLRDAPPRPALPHLKVASHTAHTQPMVERRMAHADLSKPA